MRAGRTLKWDPARERFHNDDEANTSDAQRSWIDRDRLDPADREQYAGEKAEQVDMRQRTEPQPPVVARARIAKRAGHARNRHTVDAAPCGHLPKVPPDNSARRRLLLSLSFPDFIK